MGAEVYLGGTRVRLDPSQLIGEGGEAEVFLLPDGRALKLFKPAEHPDFALQPAAAEAARERLQEHQHKLEHFPPGLPAQVVVPVELAMSRASRGAVLGYAMRHVAPAQPLRSLWDLRQRQTMGVEDVAAVFADLAGTVAALHARQMLVGDLNASNVLLQRRVAVLIDADSYGLPGYPCRVYSERTVDPLRCDPTATRPIPCGPANAAGDWYALAVLLFRALLLVEPWGGVYRPAAPAHPARAGLAPGDHLDPVGQVRIGVVGDDQRVGQLRRVACPCLRAGAGGQHAERADHERAADGRLPGHGLSCAATKHVAPSC